MVIGYHDMKRIKNFITHPFILGSSIMVIGSMFVNVINFVYHILMGRFLGPVQYGVLASVFSVLYIISIVPQSANVSIVKFISSSFDIEDQSKTYWALKRFVVKFGIFIALFIFLVSPFIMTYLHLDSIYKVIYLAPIFYLSLHATYNQAVAQGKLDFLSAVIPNFISGAGKLLIGLLLVVLGFAVDGALFGILIAVLIAVLYLERWSTKKFIKIENISFDYSKFIKYSIPVIVQALALTAFVSLDVILARHYFLSFDAGLYAALSTLGKIVYFATTPVFSVMFPNIVKSHAQNKPTYKYFFLSIFFVMIISFFALFTFTFFHRQIFQFSYGSQYFGFDNLLPFFGLYMVVYSFVGILIFYNLALGKTFVSYIALFGSVVYILSIFLFHMSVMNMIVASIFSCLFLLLLLTVYTILSFE